MANSRVLSVFFVLLSLAVTMHAFSIEMPLHRIARTPQLNAALLVPFPRVGKRSSAALNDEMQDSEASPEISKRLYFARVGKRFMYAARVGRK